MAKTCLYEGCKHQRFGGGYCKYHQRFREDGGKPKPMPKISDKQSERMSRYMPIRNKFLEENPICMVQRPEGCLFQSTNVHHGKGKVGELLFDTKYFIACCSGDCHRWAETHPEEAQQLGVSFKRLVK